MVLSKYSAPSTGAHVLFQSVGLITVPGISDASFDPERDPQQGRFNE